MLRSDDTAALALLAMAASSACVAGRVLLEYGGEAGSCLWRLGSSAVEQGTHKPLVGCSNHPRVKFQGVGRRRRRRPPSFSRY
jgi:hypothetical protein